MSGLSVNLTDADRRFTFVSAAPGAAAFDVVSMTGFEAISKNFSFELILVCDEADVDFQVMLSNPATFTIYAPGAKAATPYYGVLEEFEQMQQAGTYVFYRAVLQPRFQALGLSRTSDVHIDGTRIPDLIGSILKEQGRFKVNVDFELKVNQGNPGPYLSRDFICQYQETDLDFLRRWMEHEGIYYYFDHSGTVEKLVIVDATTGLPADAAAGLVYRPNETVQSDDNNNSLQSWVCKQKQLPQYVTLRGFNFARAALVLENTADVSAKGKGTVMLYGESFLNDVECPRYAGIRAQEIACQGTVFEGRASAVGLRSGYFLTMAGHYRSEWVGPTYLVTEIQHQGSQAGALLKGLSTPFGQNSGETTYSASFKAIPKLTPFRPERITLKPYIAGSVTAIIDGTSGSQYADVDETGRYRVMFPFCKAGKAPSKRSSRVRMATPYSGPGYGMNFPLHAGVEVMVSFLEGDPDQPVIVNAVPNSENPNVTTDKNYMLGMIKTAAGNALLFDDTKNGQSGPVYSPVGSSQWRIGQRFVEQAGGAVMKQKSWGDGHPGLHGSTQESASIAAGQALVLTAGDIKGGLTTQAPVTGDIQILSSYGLLNIGNQPLLGQPPRDPGLAPLPDPDPKAPPPPPTKPITGPGADGALDIYAKHINMFAEPKKDANGVITSFGYIMQSGGPKQGSGDPWGWGQLYALQNFTTDYEASLTAKAGGQVTVLGGSKTTFTQGHTNSATYGDSSSLTHGNSIKLVQGTDQSHTYGMSSSMYFGMKNDLTVGATNSVFIGTKTDTSASAKLTVALSAAVSLSIGAELKASLSATLDFAGGIKTGVNTVADISAKAIEAKAAATKLVNSVAEIANRTMVLQNETNRLDTSIFRLQMAAANIFT